MQVDKTPSEKIVANPIDGYKLQDKLGRTFVLRKPDLLDMYDLYSAIGEDANNRACLMMATKVLYVAAIDGSPVPCPKSYSEFRATMKRISSEGFLAIDEAFEKIEAIAPTEKEMIEKVKK